MRFKKIRGSIHGFRGLRIAFAEEASFRIELFWAAVALIATYFFRVSPLEFAMVAAMIGLVFAAEVFNTCIEEICDIVTIENDPHIGKIKDLAAGAVLIAWLTALTAGIVIFIPHFLRFLSL